MAQGTEPARWWAGVGTRAGGRPVSKGDCVLPNGAGCPCKQAPERWSVRGACVASSATSAATPSSKRTVAARRPSKLSSRSAASRPASSASKARNTRGKASKLPATRSMPCVPRAATAGNPHWDKGKPVEQALPRQDYPGRRLAPSRPRSKHRLGSGQRLEPRRPLRVNGPAHKPADASRGQVGNHHHPSEPLAPLGEQARGPYPLAAESGAFKVSAQPVPRRVAKTQAAGGIEADVPEAQILTRLGLLRSMDRR